MTLSEHLRELRRRMFVAALAIVVGAIVGWVFYDQITKVLNRPLTHYAQVAAEHGHQVSLILTGVTDPFSLKLSVAFFAGLLLASPVWIYETWAFVAPGLRHSERKWTVVFVAAATPLFAAGVALGYWILPKTLDLLLGLSPPGVANLVTVDAYYSFLLRLMFAFGLAFLVPLFAVGLNAVGILSADRMRRWWRGAVLAVFVFAAVITPTPDPWNMTLLATPILVLLLVAYVIALLNDRRRARRRAEQPEWADDETSPVDPNPSPLDEPDQSVDDPGRQR